MAENQNTMQNPLGSKPINKLIISMSVPLMFSMLVQAMYNIVDSIFVARLGEESLTAVSLVFPVQNLMIAVAVGTSIGMNAIMSRRLGEGRKEEAVTIVHNGVILAFLSWVVFAVFGLFGSRAFMEVSSDNPEVIASGISYMSICLILSFGIFMQITMERVLQATGKTTYQMIAQTTGAVVNIVLDPILIFGLFGAPELGIAGAAYATVIGQWCGMTLCLVLNQKFNNEIKLSIKKFKLELNAVIEIYKIGFPSIVMQSIGSVMVFFFNQILTGFSGTAVAVFGIYFKLLSFVFMPLFAVVNSLVPIVGFNFGARNRKRIVDVIKSSLIIGVIIMTLGMLIFMIFTKELLLMFDASEEMLEIGIPALRILSICFIPANFAIMFSSVFQALGHGMLSLWISFARQIIVLLPCAWLLATFFGLHAIWFSFPLAEIMAIVLSLSFYAKLYKKEILPLDAPLDERI